MGNAAKFFVALALASAPFFASAEPAETSLPLPSILLWHDQPIEPYCFDSFVEPFDSPRASSVDLNNCSKHEDIEINPENHSLKAPKYISDYRPKNGPQDQDDQQFPEEIEYQYIGMAKDMAIVFTGWSGGGTGWFTGGLGLQRDGDTLRVVKEFPGGDRCNGGIYNIEVKGNSVVVDNAITSADMLTILPGLNPHQLKPYEALEYSATGCIGQVRHVDGKVTAFIPTDNAPDLPPQTNSWGKSYLYQSCFSKLMDGIPNDNPWTVIQIKEFMHHFNRSCVEQSAVP